jgi:hypothetical protein
MNFSQATQSYISEDDIPHISGWLFTWYLVPRLLWDILYGN